MLPAFFHQTPFFRLLLPFVTGIAVGFCFTIPAGYCILVCVLSMMISGIFLWKWNRLVPRRRGWLYGIFLNVFLLAAGVGTVSLQSFTPIEQAGQGAWLAVVTEPPTEKENSMKATVHIRANLTDEPASVCDEHVMTYFRKDSLSRRIRQGDLLVIVAALNPVTNAGNPYEFDYRGYLARKHIGRSAFVESGNWQQLDSYAQGPLFNFSNRIRNSLLDVFKRGGLSGNELSVASALVLGYKADLDDALRKAYSASGAMHVLAVSGLHVGIIYVVLTVILKLAPFLHRIKWLRALILLAALWLFALITGLSPSVMRATTMFSFIAAGDALRRRAYIYNSIAASAFILLLVNPDNLFDVGFQLSYLAVIAIVFLHPFLYGLLSFNHRLLNDVWNLTCVSIAAQIGTAPLALFYFHQFPMYFIFSNFVVIPAATVIIYGALLLFLVSPVPALLEAAGWLLDRFLYLINFCIFFIEKLPGSVISGIRFAGWEILFAYALVATISTWILTKHKTALLATLTVIAFWITGAAIRTGHDLRRQQLIVYHTQGNSLLQFVDGRESAVWYAGRYPSFNASGFTESQRIAMHLKDSQFYLLDSALCAEKEFCLPDLYSNGNFMQFAGKRLVIFTRDMLPQNAGQSSIRTDAAILTQNVNARIPQIIESYHPGMIVIDASSSQARIDRWEKECAEAGVVCHRVDRDGAFIFRSTTW
jgi:competence protein ComEC